MYYLYLRRSPLQPLQVLVVQERLIPSRNHLWLRKCGWLYLRGHCLFFWLYHRQSRAPCVHCCSSLSVFLIFSPVAVVVTSDGLLDDELSGIMGLGFEPLSALETSPFWQTLMNQNKLSSPVFSFYLERYVNQAEMDEAPGGTFTLGGTNTSLYSGNIEFINIPSGDTPSYWFQQVQCEGNHCCLSFP